MKCFWYLNEAILLKATQPIHKDLKEAIEETERLANLSPDELMKINVPLQSGSEHSSFRNERTSLEGNEYCA